MAHGRVMVSTWFMGEDRDTPYDGSSETPNPLQEKTRIRVLMISTDVRLSRSLGIQFTATVPDITRSAVVTTGSGVFNFSENFSGLGDSSLILWGRKPTMTWMTTWNVGASLPTGKTEPPRFQSELTDGSLVPVSRLQRGTGTFDPLIGVTVSRIVKGIFPPGIRVMANGAARIPFYENEHGLRTGASWEVSGGASREVKYHWVVAIGRLSWLHREQDVFNGVPVLVGGGDWLLLTPGVAVSHRAFTFQGEVRLPLYRSLANRQLDSGYSVQAGMVWAVF